MYLKSGVVGLFGHVFLKNTESLEAVEQVIAAGGDFFGAFGFVLDGAAKAFQNLGIARTNARVGLEIDFDGQNTGFPTDGCTLEFVFFRNSEHLFL